MKLSRFPLMHTSCRLLFSGSWLVPRSSSLLTANSSFSRCIRHRTSTYAMTSVAMGAMAIVCPCASSSG